MAIPHANSGEVVEIRPLGPALAETRTSTLVKTPTLEVIRLILQPGKEICHQHAVAGEVLVQCLEGRIAVQIDGDSRALEAGQMLYLAGGVPHVIRGVSDSSALLTILLR
jgi:quercetin dioxygenase-like cupin family protein